MSDAPLPSPALHAQRERTIARLCEHFARDHLDAEELERLIDGAHAATSPAELEALLVGLPALSALPAHAEEPGAPTRPGHGGEFQLVVAVMGGADRRGPWTPARTMVVTALMGGAVLDFRRAHFQPGVTEVYVLAVMGGVEIVVPPGTYVESNGIGIMGGFEHAGSGRFPVDSSVPTLRVSGVAFMGGVEIRVQAPGEEVEDRRDSRRHLRRDLRRDLRRLERGEPPDAAGWPRRGR